MDLGLSGKAALVAGASRGLGRAVARALAVEGADVAICARSREHLDDAARDIAAARAAGAREDAGARDHADARVVTIAADLTADDGPVQVVRRAIAELGKVDILVANCGGPPAGPFEAHDRAAWRDAMRANFETTVDLVREVLPGMKARRWGRIIAITSIAAKQPVDGLILSNAARAAVTGFARTLANEVAAHGITVNNAMPGYTRTARVEALAQSLAERRGCEPADVVDGWAAQIPAGRIGEPAEFAALVAFLASEPAGYITGASIPVDGGWIRALV